MPERPEHLSNYYDQFAGKVEPAERNLGHSTALPGIVRLTATHKGLADVVFANPATYALDLEILGGANLDGRAREVGLGTCGTTQRVAHFGPLDDHPRTVFLALKMRRGGGADEK